ncbi:unnamed protein product [Fusarium graminearum]|nr:unnamed protein product [Fusarium graminearum]VTO81667.1 unnamed protein product [Fusarium graminearum]
MSLKSTLSNAPVSTPDDKPHLFYAYLAQKSLTICVDVCCRSEEIVCFDTAIKELAEDAYYCEGSSHRLGGHYAGEGLEVEVAR